jgi:hypothetical protein
LSVQFFEALQLSVFYMHKKSLEIPPWEIIIRISAYKTKDRVTRTPLKPGVNSGAPEGSADPAALVTTVVLI